MQKAVLNFYIVFVLKGTHSHLQIYGTGLNPFLMMRRYVGEGNNLFSFVSFHITTLGLNIAW